MIQIAESVKQYLIATVVPFATSSIVTWLVSAHVFALLSINPTSAAKAITGALIFVVTWGFNQLLLHKILGGHFTPAARRALAAIPSDRLDRARQGL